MKDRPSFAWSGPCDVIFRRHPKGGYIVSIIGDGTHAVFAHGLSGVAEYLARKDAAPTADPLSDTPLTLEQAGRLVEAMRGLNLLVDDKVLKIDGRMVQWGRIAPTAVVAALIACAAFAESMGLAWGLLIFAIGLVVGTWLRHEYERDGVLIPSPWILPMGAGMLALAVGGFALLMMWMMWAKDNIGGVAGFVVGMVGWTVLPGAVGVGAYRVVQYARSRKKGSSVS